MWNCYNDDSSLDNIYIVNTSDQWYSLCKCLRTNKLATVMNPMTIVITGSVKVRLGYDTLPCA